MYTTASIKYLPVGTVLKNMALSCLFRVHCPAVLYLGMFNYSHVIMLQHLNKTVRKVYLCVSV